MSPVETKLANLLISLRETAATAEQLANQVEKAILALYEPAGEEIQQPKKPEVKPSFNFNKDLLDLIAGKQVNFDMSPANICDLRDYAFIKVHANTGSTVSFTYATASSYVKMCFMKTMSPEVMEMLKPNSIYVVHNGKRNGKNFWDATLKCEGEEYQITSRAKKLAKLFAELKKEGKL